MVKIILALLFFGICSCAVRKSFIQTDNFISESLNNPKKFEAAENPSRYWAFGNFLIHFVSNANEQNKNQTPIIYIHGLGGSLDGFSELIKIIHSGKSAKPYYAIDLPPFGRSALQQSEFTLHDYAEMLQEFIEMLPVPKVSLVCHSMGGQICIDFALSHPNEIQLLTLISPAGVYEKSPFVNNATTKFVGISVGDVDHPHAKSFADMFWYSQDFTRRMITNDPLILIAVESFRDNFHDRVKKLKTKTLIIWGREDKILNFENGIYLKENVENSTLYVIDGAEHTPLKTHAPLISKLIQKHL